MTTTCKLSPIKSVYFSILRLTNTSRPCVTPPPTAAWSSYAGEHVERRYCAGRSAWTACLCGAVLLLGVLPRAWSHCWSDAVPSLDRVVPLRFVWAGKRECCFAGGKFVWRCSYSLLLSSKLLRLLLITIIVEGRVFKQVNISRCLSTPYELYMSIA